MALDSIPDLLDELRAGRMVVVMDDEDRENEGDLIMAAAAARPEDINFMTREARGLVCLALTTERCAQLGLKPMVSDNTSLHHTNFTTSIEAAAGVTTGISAFDRARTIQVAVAADARPSDIVQPGHIFPLTAQPGGVLSRAGHTEAASDLARLAGFEPAGVLVEILRADGHMARRPELELFAAEHGLKIGTVADLIRHRLTTEKTVERVYRGEAATEFGQFDLTVYRDRLQGGLHFALARGAIDDGQPVLTRVHAGESIADVLHLVDGGGATTRAALARIAAEDRGVLVLLADDHGAEAFLAGLQGRDRQARAGAGDHGWRELGLGAQILVDLGVRHLRVLGTQRKLVGLAGFGLDVVAYEALG